MFIPTTSFAAILLLAPCAFAQERVAEGSPGQQLEAKKAGAKRQGQKSPQKGGDDSLPGKTDMLKEAPVVDESRLSPEERLDLHKVHGMRGKVHFESAVDPERVPPGGNGTLLITMVMEGDTVITSPAPVHFDFIRQQGPFSVGEPALQPAKNARLAQAFLGRPAYDNYVLIEVPFSVGTATFGKLPISIGVTTDLFLGKTGAPIGRFVDSVTTQVEIGIPPTNVPPRATVGVMQPGNIESTNARGTEPNARPPAADKSPKSVLEGQGGTAKPKIVGGEPGLHAEGEHFSDLEIPVVPDSDPFPLPLILASAGLGGLLLFLVFRRR